MLSDSTAFLVVTVAVHITGAACALRAAAGAHTAQGGVAWAMGLVLLPWISIPLYAIFGPPAVDRRADGLQSVRTEALARAGQACGPIALPPDALAAHRRHALEALGPLPTLLGPRPELLVDGTAFDAVFEVIDTARHRIFLQFFIVRDDDLGRRVKTRLAERAREGLDIRFLYDSVGSRTTPARYWHDLAAAGVRVLPFALGRRLPKILRLNYRNHRKIVAADGRVAIIGGHNIGDEYLGLDPFFGPWRDTAIRLAGAPAAAVEASFVEDWLWAGGEPVGATEPPAAAPAPRGDCPTLILPTGPADGNGACTLMFCHLIGEARERLWIATPYFVPDLDVLTALRLAALRGVDVRILTPERADYRIVWLAGLAFAEEAHRGGIDVRYYRPGFMHQKALLVDGWAAAVGTANLDNRSLRLNFEITAIVFCEGFAAEVTAMFEADFRQSRPFNPADLAKMHAARLLAPAARLAAPIL